MVLSMIFAYIPMLFESCNRKILAIRLAWYVCVFCLYLFQVESPDNVKRIFRWRKIKIKYLLKINVTHKLSHRTKCMEKTEEKKNKCKINKKQPFLFFLSYKMRNRKMSAVICIDCYCTFLTLTQMHIRIHIYKIREEIDWGLVRLICSQFCSILTNLSLSFGERFISRIISVSFFCHANLW